MQWSTHWSSYSTSSTSQAAFSLVKDTDPSTMNPAVKRLLCGLHMCLPWLGEEVHLLVLKPWMLISKEWVYIVPIYCISITNIIASEDFANVTVVTSSVLRLSNWVRKNWKTSAWNGQISVFTLIMSPIKKKVLSLVINNDPVSASRIQTGSWLQRNGAWWLKALLPLETLGSRKPVFWERWIIKMIKSYKFI